MQLDPEFVRIADIILTDIRLSLDPHRRQLLEPVEFLIWAEPSEYYLKSTGTGSGQLLLGAYEEDDSSPPRVSIFQSSLVKIGNLIGDVSRAIRETLLHEVWQHALGTDHPRET